MLPTWVGITREMFFMFTIKLSVLDLPTSTHYQHSRLHNLNSKSEYGMGWVLLIKTDIFSDILANLV